MTTTNHRARRRHLVTAVASLALLAAACGSNDDGGERSRSAPATTSTTAATARPTGLVDELVAIGAGRLHVRCTGRGDATVLLLSGWDHASGDWAAVEPTIAEHARVCSYDRFGTGTSDAPSTPQTFEMQVADLHELLAEVGEPGPYVVVGHSFGGAEAVTFASAYADEVAGVLLVDASPNTWPDTVCSIPAYAAGCALMRNPSQGERLDVFPAFAAVARITALGDVPMTVMSAADRSPDGLTPEELARLTTLWAEGTDDWAQLSTRSRVVTVDDTGHAIHIDQPAIVVDAIVQLIPQSGDQS